jgi:hypothetical protein
MAKALATREKLQDECNPIMGRVASSIWTAIGRLATV